MPGPPRNPNSRRGQAELRKSQRLAIAVVPPPRPSGKSAAVKPGLPLCDPRLPLVVRERYAALVSDLANDGVPIKRSDVDSVVLAARCLAAVDMWGEIELDGDQPIEVRISAAKNRQAASKDLIQWLPAINATPSSKIRAIGKPEPERQRGPIAKLAERLQRG